MKILCLSATLPWSTGAGGAVACYGLGKALNMSGHDVSFIIINPSEQSRQQTYEFPVRFLDQSGNFDLNSEIKRLNPDVVWVFNYICWSFFADYRNQYPHILVALDPPWEIELLRHRLRKPKAGFSRVFVNWFRHEVKVSSLRREEKRILKQASEFGIAVGYTVPDASEMAQRSGAAVKACPLVYPDWGQRNFTPVDETHEYLLLGNMDNTHTRYGLRFFFDEIWPTWSKHHDRGRSIVRVVGGGKLPDGFLQPEPHPLLKWVGFAPSLNDEWNRATALLVPVPLTQGTRSRVVEAWCKGVPIVSHPAAEHGLPEMRAGENYLSARTAREWMAAIDALEHDPALIQRLAENGRKTFLQSYGIEQNASRFDRFSVDAKSRFESRQSIEPR